MGMNVLIYLLIFNHKGPKKHLIPAIFQRPSYIELTLFNEADQHKKRYWVGFILLKIHLKYQAQHIAAFELINAQRLFHLPSSNKFTISSLQLSVRCVHVSAMSTFPVEQSIRKWAGTPFTPYLSRISLPTITFCHCE